MKLSTLKKRLSQLNAKLRLFLRWNAEEGISNYGSRRVRDTIFQILKLEAKIENLEQSQALPNKSMKLSTLKKRLSQLNAKLRLFLRWNAAEGISNYGSRRVRDAIFQILKLEAKIENLEQSQALPNKRKNQSHKEDFSKKPNSKIFKAFRDKFENSTIIIPEINEDDEYPSKLSIKYLSGEISINNYQVLPSNYFFKYWGKKKIPEISSQLHGLYAAIGAVLAKR